MHAAPTASAGEPVIVEIWHSQSQAKRDTLREIVNAFNAGQSGIRVNEIYVGPYTQLYHKLTPAIRARPAPDLVVAYESMVSSFARAGAVEAFDGYLNDPEIGLSPESRADIFPVFLETNRYPQYGNRMLSFPFTKSLLMLYYNLDLLRKAGHKRGPETWTEFIRMCRDVKKAGKQGYALSIDPSTLDGMVYSFGGEVISEDFTRVQFDQPPAIAALKVIETLIAEGLAYRIPHHTYDDRNDVAYGRAAFLIRSSTTAPYLREIIRKGGLSTDWDMSLIPHGEGCEPVTVLFGANICMFKTTPEVQRAAWQFVKYFVSTDATAKWAMATGYMPVRRSATQLPQMQAYYAREKQNRRTLEALPCARNEPSASGWQGVRQVLLAAEANLCQGRPATEVAGELQREAQEILDDRIGPPERRPADPGFLIPLGAIAAVLIAGLWAAARHREA